MSDIKTVQIGQLVTGDFEDKTLTFEMNNDFIIKAGTFAIMERSVFNEMKRALNSCKMSLQAHPDNTTDSEFEGFVSLADEILNKVES
jgi:hypothetical protein